MERLLRNSTLMSHAKESCKRQQYFAITKQNHNLTLHQEQTLISLLLT